MKNLKASLIMLTLLVGGITPLTVQAQVKVPDEVPMSAADRNKFISVERKVKVSTWLEVKKNTPNSNLIGVQFENIRTGEKFVTSYSVDVKIWSPYSETKPVALSPNPNQTLAEKKILPRFEIDFTPYKRQILGNGTPDPALQNGLVLGKTEIKRNRNVFSVTIYALGTEFSRKLELGSPQLRLFLGLGIHTLGYRYISRGGTTESFSGLELIGAYPTARVEYDLNKTITLAFSVDDVAKYATDLSHTGIVENKLNESYLIKPHLTNKFLSHLESVWFKSRQRTNGPGSFVSEDVKSFGTTWIFKNKKTAPVEKCTLTEEEKATGLKCLEN